MVKVKVFKIGKRNGRGGSLVVVIPAKFAKILEIDETTTLDCQIDFNEMEIIYKVK